MSLSLSPRYDLFKLSLPKDFLPESVIEKYSELLSYTPGVITNPVDYLNESIKGVRIPGISSLVTEQIQHEYNQIKRNNIGSTGLGRINVEPSHSMVYKSTGNPLEKIEKEFKVIFRMNQGLYNYFMLYETIFNYYNKDIDKINPSIIYMEILDETGTIRGRIIFKNVHIDGIEGLDFSYDKTIRDEGTFEVTFKYNNIDFEFIPIKKEES